MLTFEGIHDDPSQSARAKNAEAWLKAMNAMETAAAPRTETLLISGGKFYFPGPVFMSRQCIIHGDGGSRHSVSQLFFPYNDAGIVADPGANPDDPAIPESPGHRPPHRQLGARLRTSTSSMRVHTPLSSAGLIGSIRLGTLSSARVTTG